MENKMIAFEAVKRKYGLDDKKFGKIISAIQRRHKKDMWVVARIDIMGKRQKYLRMEGVEWIERVYYRKYESYLEAEIKFALTHIQRLQNEMEIHQELLPTEKMTITELATYLSVSRTSLMKNLKNLSLEEFCLVGKNKMILPQGIKHLVTQCYKQRYLQILNDHKRFLQSEKRRSESK